MNVYLEESALAYAYLDNYPFMSLQLASTDELDRILDMKRKAKGYPTFFDETDEKMWDNGWYDFYVKIDLKEKRVTDLWGEVHSNTTKDEVPDSEENYDIKFNSVDIISQIEKQLNDDYNTSLEDLRKESEEDAALDTEEFDKLKEFMKGLVDKYEIKDLVASVYDLYQEYIISEKQEVELYKIVDPDDKENNPAQLWYDGHLVTEVRNYFRLK